MILHVRVHVVGCSHEGIRPRQVPWLPANVLQFKRELCVALIFRHFDIAWSLVELAKDIGSLPVTRGKVLGANDKLVHLRTSIQVQALTGRVVASASS
jgi:hypothetical protein